MPVLALFLCSGYAFSVLKTIAAAFDAPIGYEDENGFHYGMPTTAPVRDR